MCSSRVAPILKYIIFGARVEVVVQECSESYPVGPRPGQLHSGKCAINLTNHRIGFCSDNRMDMSILSSDEIGIQVQLIHCQARALDCRITWSAPPL